MKTLLVALIFLSVFYGCAKATKPATGSPEGTTTAGSTNAPENSMRESDMPINSVNIGKVEASRTGEITVEILNSANKPLRLWRDSNSWGAASWRVLLVRHGQLETFFQNPDQVFTVNRPAFNEIAPGGRFEQRFDLNGGNWCGLGHCSIHSERGFGGKKFNFEPNDTVIVIYDVSATQEARDLGVWYGVIAATATVP